MSLTINIGVIGYRGSGKTTLCYKLVGIDPPVRPTGTCTLDYLTCTWDQCNVLVWDYPPGVNDHTRSQLREMDCLVLCVDGRNTRSARNALELLGTSAVPVVVAVTRVSAYIWSIPLGLVDWGSAVHSVPMFPCYSSADTLAGYIRRRFIDGKTYMRSSDFVQI